MMQAYEPLSIILQVTVETPTPADEAWVWVAGVLMAANIAQWTAAQWRTRQDLKRLAERDAVDARRQENVERLLAELDRLRAENREAG